MGRVAEQFAYWDESRSDSGTGFDESRSDSPTGCESLCKIVRSANLIVVSWNSARVGARDAAVLCIGLKKSKPASHQRPHHLETKRQIWSTTPLTLTRSIWTRPLNKQTTVPVEFQSLKTQIDKLRLAKVQPYQPYQPSHWPQQSQLKTQPSTRTQPSIRTQPSTRAQQPTQARRTIDHK